MEVERTYKGDVLEPLFQYNIYDAVTERLETTHQRINDPPLCFILQTDLLAQYREAKVEEVLKNPRDCKQFTKYQQGFTPKEHKEMVDREREKRWHLIELSIIIFGNIIAGCVGAYLVWLVSHPN